MSIRAIIQCDDDAGIGLVRAPSPLTTTIIASGNSGTDPISLHGGLGFMLNHVFGTSGTTPQRSTSAGSPWSWRISNPTNTTYDGWNDIALFEILHITDNSGIAGGMNAARMWAEHAWTNGNGGAGAEVLIWTPQLTRFRLDLDAWAAQVKAHFIQAQDEMNRLRPNHVPPARIIPGLWAFDFIRNDPAAPATEGPSFWNRLYTDPNYVYNTNDEGDPFHVQPSPGTGHVASRTGIYLINAINVCCIYGVSPHLLPDSDNQDAALGAPMDPAHVLYLKRVIYDVVSTFPRSGVDTSGWQRP